MLVFNFTRIFKARGINKPFSFLVKAGYSDNFATRVVNNRMQRFNLSDLEKLCNLLQCTPNDLLEWIPESNDLANASHTLSALKRTDKHSQLSQLLHTVPLEKLDHIQTLIQKEIGE